MSLCIEYRHNHADKCFIALLPLTQVYIHVTKNLLTVLQKLQSQHLVIIFESLFFTLLVINTIMLRFISE